MNLIGMGRTHTGAVYFMGAYFDRSHHLLKDRKNKKNPPLQELLILIY